MILEQRVVELSKENHVLKAQLTAIKDKFGISGESVVSVEQVIFLFLNTSGQTSRQPVQNLSLFYFLFSRDGLFIDIGISIGGFSGG